MRLLCRLSIDEAAAVGGQPTSSLATSLAHHGVRVREADVIDEDTDVKVLYGSGDASVGRQPWRRE